MQKQLLLFETDYAKSFGEIQSKLESILPFLWQSIDAPFQDMVHRRETDEGFRVLKLGEVAQWLPIPPLGLITYTHDVYNRQPVTA